MMRLMSYKKTNIHLPENTRKTVKREAKKRNMTAAALYRNIIQEWINRGMK